MLQYVKILPFRGDATIFCMIQGQNMQAFSGMQFLEKNTASQWLVNKMSSIEWSRHFLKELIYWASWVEFLEIDEWTRVNWNNFLCSKNRNFKIRTVWQFSFAAIYEYGTRFSKFPNKLLPILKSILSQLGEKTWHQRSTFSFCSWVWFLGAGKVLYLVDLSRGSLQRCTPNRIN